MLNKSPKSFTGHTKIQRGRAQNSENIDIANALKVGNCEEL